MVTPKPDVDRHKYAENVEKQIIQLTNVKTIPKSKCPNCDSDHIAGSRECEAEKRERSKKFKQKKK